MIEEERNDEMTLTESTLDTQVNQPTFWKELWQQAQLAYYLMRDPDVPIYLKAMPLLALVYVLSPVDFIPGAVIPVLGQLDDLTAILVGVKMFVDMAPPHIVARYMDQLTAGQLVEKSPDDLDTAIIIDAKHEIVNKK